MRLCLTKRSQYYRRDNNLSKNRRSRRPFMDRTRSRSRIHLTASVTISRYSHGLGEASSHSLAPWFENGSFQQAISARPQYHVQITIRSQKPLFCKGFVAFETAEPRTQLRAVLLWWYQSVRTGRFPSRPAKQSQNLRTYNDLGTTPSRNRCPPCFTNHDPTEIGCEAAVFDISGLESSGNPAATDYNVERLIADPAYHPA